MLFPDYNETKVVYHVASITELKKILKEGIKYNSKDTYKSKYYGFHKYLDYYKPNNIPNWVVREKAIFASLNFDENHTWHSHSVILGIKINPNRCWYANENYANEIYEPFILKDIEDFKCAKIFLRTYGKELVKRYWESSMDFFEGLKFENVKPSNYDSEIMIFHDILPNDIKILAIISDHKFMNPDKWKAYFLDKGGCNFESWEITK